MSNTRTYNSFTEYLTNSDYVERVRANAQDKYFKFLPEEQKIENFSRLFNEVGNADDLYFDKTLDAKKLQAVKASMEKVRANYTEDQLNNLMIDDPNAFRALAQTKEVLAWIEDAYAQALRELFNADGDINESMVGVLKKAGISDELMKKNEFKQALISSYMTNIVGASDSVKALFDASALPVNYQASVTVPLENHMRSHQLKTIDRQFMAEHAKISGWRKWLPYVLAGVGVALGIAAIVATTVLTAGAALPIWAIVVYAVGATLAATGVGAVIFETFRNKKGDVPAPASSDNNKQPEAPNIQAQQAAVMKNLESAPSVDNKKDVAPGTAKAKEAKAETGSLANHSFIQRSTSVKNDEPGPDNVGTPPPQYKQ